MLASSCFLEGLGVRALRRGGALGGDNTPGVSGALVLLLLDLALVEVLDLALTLLR